MNPLAKQLFENNESQLQNHYIELAEINAKLWEIEDEIRECERNKEFGAKFVELARSVYITNDQRCEVKKLSTFLQNLDLLRKNLIKNINNGN